MAAPSETSATEVLKESEEGRCVSTAAPNMKHDWYQTESHVVVTLLLRQANPDDVAVNLKETEVDVCATAPSGSYHLNLHLAHPITAKLSGYRVLPSKIEVKMRKAHGHHWESLEGEGVVPSIHSFSQDTRPAYPSASGKNWDALASQLSAEEKREKSEGDAALNHLFQQIYADGNEDVRRAMNKSFVESGGTVLSTNWGEVGQEKVEVKPPDGLEWRNYEI
uniref:protein SGT1 homolog isoform X1 n=1 Tax=Myxine glutinosa TaxID=7769 RepID=UPI00358F346C